MSNFRIITGESALAHSVRGRLTVVYGVPGAGKTTLGITATETGKTLFIDTENSIGKVFEGVAPKHKNLKNLASVNVNTVSEAVDFLDEIENELDDFSTIVFDSATHLVEEEMRRLRTSKVKLAQSDWGDVGNKFKELLAMLQSRGINVIITVHEEETADDSGVMQHRPKTEGKMAAAALVLRADNLLFIETNTDGERLLHTQPSPRFYAKSRDPLQTSYVGDDVNYATLSADFAKARVVFASAANEKELEALMKEAKVSDVEKFKDAISWTAKGKLNFLDFEEGVSLMKNQIQSNNTPKDDVTSNPDS